MERVEFFEEYAIFKKNSAKLCGTDAFENLVCSAPVRLSSRLAAPTEKRGEKSQAQRRRCSRGGGR